MVHFLSKPKSELTRSIANTRTMGREAQGRCGVKTMGFLVKNTRTRHFTTVPPIAGDLVALGIVMSLFASSNMEGSTDLKSVSG